MAKVPKNMTASVRHRLLNLARENGQAFKAVLATFGLERLIYPLLIFHHRRRICPDGGGALVTLRTSDGRRFASDIGFIFIRSDDETNFQLRFSGKTVAAFQWPWCPMPTRETHLGVINLKLL